MLVQDNTQVSTVKDFGVQKLHESKHYFIVPVKSAVVNGLFSNKLTILKR